MILGGHLEINHVLKEARFTWFIQEKISILVWIFITWINKSKPFCRDFFEAHEEFRTWLALMIIKPLNLGITSDAQMVQVKLIITCQESLCKKRRDELVLFDNQWNFSDFLNIFEKAHPRNELVLALFVWCKMNFDIANQFAYQHVTCNTDIKVILFRLASTPRGFKLVFYNLDGSLST